MIWLSAVNVRLFGTAVRCKAKLHHCQYPSLGFPKAQVLGMTPKPQNDKSDVNKKENKNKYNQQHWLQYIFTQEIMRKRQIKTSEGLRFNTCREQNY